MSRLTPRAALAHCVWKLDLKPPSVMTPSMTRARDNLKAITGLRFIAAAYVFAFHIQIRWPLPVAPFLDHLLRNGAAGMSLFFILSGYILSHVNAGRELGLAEYGWKRVARIYPVYLAAAMATTPTLVLELMKAPHPAATATMLAGLDLGVLQAWIPSAFWFWNNDASWSISAEAFFYLCFPLILPLIWSAKRPWLLAGPVFIATVLPGALYYLLMGSGLTVFYAMPIFRLPEFVAGILTFRLSRSWSGRHADAVIVAAIGALILALGLRTTTDIYVTNNWIVVPVCCALIAAAGTGQGLIGKVLGSPVFEWLGRVSYGFYSWQAFVLMCLLHLIPRVPILQHSWAAAAAGFVTLQTIAGLSYHYIEEPARRSIQRWAAARKPLGASASAKVFAN